MKKLEAEERPDDYRAVPHPDAVERWAKGTLYEWVTCVTCGKEYQRKVAIEEMRDAMVKWCSICEMEHHETLDTCPEGISGPGFGSACQLPYRHKGRCKPYDSVAVIASRLPRYFP